MAEILSALKAAKPDGNSLVHGALSLLSPTGEPQRGYTWEVHIDAPLSVTKLAPTNLAAHFNQALMYYAQAVSLPEMTVDIIEDNYLGEHYQHAGKQTGGKNATITFWDDQSLTVYGYFRNWMNLVHTGGELGGTGRQTGKLDYVRTIRTQLKDTTDFMVNLEVKFVNAFCNSVSDIQNTYDSSDLMRVTVSLTFDDIILGAPVKPGSTDFVQASLNPAGYSFTGNN